MKSFRDTFDLPKRKELYEKESYMHPTKIAVIVEVHPKSKLTVSRYYK